MSDKKYALHPGYVFSKNDGDRHYIGGPELARLYGVELDECITIRRHHSYIISGASRYIHLYPDYNGHYKLPEVPDDRTV